MERKSNITVWQLKLFEGFDADIMVMQRDEEEVFDDAIHVFFEKSYYDLYVSRATKYGDHRYAYHEDKLGEVVNQVFDENIKGIVFHIDSNDAENKGNLCAEKYISAKDLFLVKDVADSYHFLYITSIDRCDRLDAIARLWTKYVYIIGQFPDSRVTLKKGENQVFEIMTSKYKNDGSQASASDYDYEAAKVFLTYESAMRANPEKKPVNKYRLSVVSRLLKGRISIAIEPHRKYKLLFDPAKINLKEHLTIPQFDENMVRERIKQFINLESAYVLLAPGHCDYKLKMGNPLLIKPDENNIVMHLFEKYEDAKAFCLLNPNILPILDATYPIGAVNNLEEIVYLAQKIGVTIINLDAETINSIGCKIDFFRDAAGYNRDIEEFLPKDRLDKVMKVEEGKKLYRLPIIDFCDRENEYDVSKDRQEEIISHIDSDLDNGYSYMAELSISEMIVMSREAAVRFDKARKEENSDDQTKYNRLMNLFTIAITEALCDKPYIFALRDDKGELLAKNNVLNLIITNRYEVNRRGEGKLVPASIDNQTFMDQLCEAGNVTALTDGPDPLCLLDTKFMRSVSEAWRKSQPLRQELMVYMTQGCGLGYTKADNYYKRLKTDNNIFAEFVETVRNGSFPSVGMLNIEGHTAAKLAQDKDLSIVEAYDTLLKIKTGQEL